MKATDVHKLEWMPIYEAIPFKNKRVVFEALGFNLSHELLRKKYISIEKYTILLKMSENLILGSKNTLGKEVDYDNVQMIKYNSGLVDLIVNKDGKNVFKDYEKHEKTKVINEQLRVQKIINKYN